MLKHFEEFIYHRKEFLGSAGGEISGAGSVGVFCSSAASFDGKVSGARSAGSLVSGVAPSGGEVADAVGLCLGVGPVGAVWFGAVFLEQCVLVLSFLVFFSSYWPSNC
ncbi:hypothetical protein ACOSQ3_014812 [Xanthoceras sorbifolium]